MDTTYYLSIKSTNLAHYIQKAIILPSRFYRNRADDIQNLFGDYLFLSKTPYVNDSDCSIELVLTENEISNLKKFDNANIMLFDKPLPISRIKHIYFCVDDKRKLTLGNINEGAGFVNEKVVKILPKTDECTQNMKTPEIEKFKYSKELESKIKDFDQKLGGVAFVRFNTNNKYSHDYFSILSFFNDYIKEELKNGQQEFTPKYHDAFSHNDKWEGLVPLIYKQITEKDVINVAEKDNIIEVTKDSAENFEYTKIDSSKNTYKLAILYNYGSGSTKRKNIDNLVSSLMDGKISSDKQDGISLIFGINNGYSVFRNQYKEKIVKFKMDSILDYYTIESIFQCIIYDKSNCKKFEYLDEIISRKPFLDDLYFETYRMMDETIVADKKTIISVMNDSVSSGILASSLFEKLINFINKLLKNKQEENSGLLNQIEKLDKNLQNNEQQLNQEKEANTSLNQKIENLEKDNKSQLEKHQIELKKKEDENKKSTQEITNLKREKEELAQKAKDNEPQPKKQKDNILMNKRRRELKDLAEEQGIKVLTSDNKQNIVDKITKKSLL